MCIQLSNDIKSEYNILMDIENTMSSIIKCIPPERSKDGTKGHHYPDSEGETEVSYEEFKENHTILKDDNILPSYNNQSSLLTFRTSSSDTDYSTKVTCYSPNGHLIEFKDTRIPSIDYVYTEDDNYNVLPIEELGNINNLVLNLERFGYFYIGVAFPGLQFQSHISCHYVNNITTDELYIAKVFDLYGINGIYKINLYKRIKLLQNLSDDSKGGGDSNNVYERPNITIQLEWFDFPNQLISILDYCDGGDLFNLINTYRKDGKVIPEDMIEYIFRQICLGISYLHNRKIVHGDIKSSNIFFKNNIPMIGDFETAHYIDEPSLDQSGTVMYMAPELVLDTRCKTNFKTDIWSLGCLLFEMLTLSHPFNDPCTINYMTEIFSNYTVHRRSILSSIPKNYHSKWSFILQGMINFNPNLRPSAEEILNTL